MEWVKVYPWRRKGIFVCEHEGQEKFLLSVKRVSEVLKIPARTLRWAIYHGTIPASLLPYPTTGKGFYVMTLDDIREACRHYKLPHAPVIDRLGDLLGWSDEEKAFCALEWEGIAREDLEEFVATGRFPWARVTARVREREQV